MRGDRLALCIVRAPTANAVAAVVSALETRRK
jgi:hypothetical protein